MRLSFILIPILFLVGAGFFYAGTILNQAQNVVEESYQPDGRESGSEKRVETVSAKEDNISILFVGVDNGGARLGDLDSGLSDALILTTFNIEERSIKMLNIPRDSYVNIPSQTTKTKINHAHSTGGIHDTIQTVENVLDVPVDYYVRLNFDAFIDTVDALGGVTVDVPYSIYEMDSNDTKGAVFLQEGTQTLNGEQTLALARTRRLDSDFERGSRQQMIMQAMLDKAISINAIANMSNVIQAIGDNMSTSLSFEDMKELAEYLLSPNLSIDELHLEGNDLWTDAYYFELDEEHLEEVSNELQTHLELSSPYQNPSSTNRLD